MSRVAKARLAAAAGCVAVLLAAFNPFVLPAVVIAVGAAVAGARRAGSDTDGAVLRLGVAVVAAGVVAVADLMTGDVLLAASSLAALALFGAAWKLADRHREHERIAWGIRQRDWLDRQQRLEHRRDQLRNNLGRREEREEGHQE